MQSRYALWMKDFDSWNNKKKVLHSDGRRKLVHTREIWWCSLGLNIGHEQDGKNELFERPVLILKKFNRHIVLIVPLTSVPKNNPFYHPIDEFGSTFAIISQIRLLSTKRFSRRVKVLNSKRFNNLVAYIIKRIFNF